MFLSTTCSLLPVVSVSKLSKLAESKNTKYQFHYGSGDSPTEGISMLLWMSCEWVMSITWWFDWLVKIYSLELVRYENAAHNFIRRVAVGILDWIIMSAMMTVYVWSTWNLLIMGETELSTIWIMHLWRSLVAGVCG